VFPPLLSYLDYLCFPRHAWTFPPPPPPFFCTWTKNFPAPPPPHSSENFINFPPLKAVGDHSFCSTDLSNFSPLCALFGMTPLLFPRLKKQSCLRFPYKMKGIIRKTFSREWITILLLLIFFLLAFGVPLPFFSFFPPLKRR